MNGVKPEPRDIQQELDALWHGGREPGKPTNIKQVLDSFGDYGIRRWDERHENKVRGMFGRLGLDVGQSANLGDIGMFYVGSHFIWSEIGGGSVGLMALDAFNKFEPVILVSDVCYRGPLPRIYAHEVGHADYFTTQQSVRSAVSALNSSPLPSHGDCVKMSEEKVLNLGWAMVRDYLEAAGTMKRDDLGGLTETYANLVELKMGYKKFDGSDELLEYITPLSEMDFLEGRKVVLESNSLAELQRNIRR